MDTCTTLQKMANLSLEEGIDTKGVLSFAIVMLSRLHETRDDGKHGWYNCDNGGLFLQLYVKIKKFKKTIEEIRNSSVELDYDHLIRMTPKVKKDLIDIANFCMMLFFNNEIL